MKTETEGRNKYFITTIIIITVFVKAFVSSCHQQSNTPAVELLGLISVECSYPLTSSSEVSRCPCSAFLNGPKM